MSIYKTTHSSPLEILTSDAPALLWKLEYNDALEKNAKELLGVNHANWKTPRRGFYFENSLYWINKPEKTLYKQEHNNILIREFDKISFSGRYVFDGDLKEVLDSFLEAGYSVIEDEGNRVMSK